jgi:hypothetical protein
MILYNKTKNFARKHCLGGLALIGLTSGIIYLANDASGKISLDNSNYILKVQENPTSLYGYDDDRNGEIDRIEEIGIIPYKNGMPALRIRKTHLPEDKNYQFYHDRIEALGESKK